MNEIPSFHTVRPPQGLVKKHEPKDSRTATFVGILKPPTFSASPTKHSLAPKAVGKQIQFLPPEQNSLAIIPRVEEERNEELWWTMEDLDRSSAEADQGTAANRSIDRTLLLTFFFFSLKSGLPS